MEEFNLCDVSGCGSLCQVTHLDKANSAFSAYRFHDDDPVFFQNGFRLTLRDGDVANGKVVGDPPLR